MSQTSFDEEEIKTDTDPNLDPNLDTETEQRDTAGNPDLDPEQGEDYKTKFSESTRENQRILAEKKELERKLAELENGPKRDEEAPSEDEDLIPGFENLDDEARQNLINYTNTVTKRAEEKLLKNPAIAFAARNYNENKFDTAMSKVISKYPELANSKDEFKSKYFNPNIVPDNIETVITDLAKVHLFDKAKNMGAEEERKRNTDRIDTERASGGDRTPVSQMSDEDWTRLSQENPKEFARRYDKEAK